MKFVGFLEGRQETDERMNDWFNWIVASRSTTNHYSVFDDCKCQYKNA